MVAKKSQLKIASLFVMASAFSFLAVVATARDLPASKTEQQTILEEKAAQEEKVKTSPELSASVMKLIEALPDDTTPGFDIKEIVLNGNTLFSDEDLLSELPAVYNSSKGTVIDAMYLYDLRPLQELMANPGSTQKISARSIQGLAQYILSIYQDHHYAGIYVYVPADAFEDGGALSQGILPVRILEAPISAVSYSYYEPNNVPSQKSYLSMETLEKWSPVKEGEVANRKKLDDFLNLLNQNPDRYVSAMFTRGEDPESLAVSYNVYEAKPDHFFIQVDNSGTKDIQWRPRFGYINTNLLGFDDKFTAVYQTTPDSTWLDDYAIYGSYDFPIWGPKLRLNLFAGYNEFNITDPDSNFLGSGKFVGGTLRYNAIQLDDWFFDLTGTIQYEESRVTPEFFPEFFETDIRLVLWGWGAELYKTTDMWDTFFGYNMLTPIDTSDIDEIQTARPDAVDNFHIHYFNARHSRYLDSNKVQRATASVRLIVPDDRLVPSKMTSFGGMYTVRGYDESEIVADGGLIASAQYEYDLVRKSQVEMYGEEQTDDEIRKPFLKKLAPLVFIDYGQARIKNHTATEQADQELCSWGGGFIVELGDNFTGTVYYGYPLIATDDTRSGKGRLHAGFLFRW